MSTKQPAADTTSVSDGRGGRLLGRDMELRSVSQFLDDVDATSATRRESAEGRLLLVGDPGVGKTALLDAAVQHARGAGFLVARASGDEFEADISFAALNQLLVPFLELLPQLPPTHRDALRATISLEEGTVHESSAVSVAVLALLTQAASRTPLLLVVDDLPWLDRASARVLAFVSRRLAATRMRLLAAMRTGEAGFLPHTDFPRLTVAALPFSAADELLRSAFPALPARVRQRLMKEAQGNPLALLELPVALDSDARASSLPSVLPLTSRLHSVFASRVEALPRATRELLLLAALDGTGDLRVLTSTPARAHGGASEHDDLVALGPAERARLVAVDPNTRLLSFRHPLTRAAVVHLATDAEKRAAHSALAARRFDDRERRAWHLAAAALGADEAVAGALEEAARRALERGDPVGAVTAFVRAADLSPTREKRRNRLARAAYLGANVTGDLDIASRLSIAASGHQDRETALLTTLAAAAQLLNHDGDLDTAHRLLTNAVEMLADTPDVDPDVVAEALHMLLFTCFFGARPDLWEPFDRAMRWLTPNASTLLPLLNATFRDPARTARPVLRELDAHIDNLASEPDPERVVRVGMAAAYLDRLNGCRAALWRVVEGGRQGGAVTSAIDALFLLGNNAFLTGEWDVVDDVADEGLKLCAEHRYTLLAWPGQFLRGAAAAARGDFATARHMRDDMAVWAAPRRLGAIDAYTNHITCLIALGQQDFEAAYTAATEVSPAGQLASHVPHALWLIWDLTDAAVRTGRVDEARMHVNAVTRSAIATLSPRLEMLVLGATALVAPARDAPAVFESALATPAGTQWPFDHARIRLSYGEHLRRTQDVTPARKHLTGARDAFRALGAVPWAERAERELRATGQTRPLQPGVVHPALTPQQRLVAELAASGLTNKQIAERLYLSPRTVGTHLYELYPKLGITSRAALRDALRSLAPAE